MLFVDVRRGFGKPLGLENLVVARNALSSSLDPKVDAMVPWRRIETEAQMKDEG